MPAWVKNMVLARNWVGYSHNHMDTLMDPMGHSHEFDRTFALLTNRVVAFETTVPFQVALVKLG
jgi:hypothetical protein